VDEQRSRAFTADWPLTQPQCTALERGPPGLAQGGFGEPGGSCVSDEGVCRIEREAVVHGMYLAQRIG
jgi:hypothetical protein